MEPVPVQSMTKPDLCRRKDGRVVLRRKKKEGPGEETPVQIVCCFPWTMPDRFISIRDDKGKELLLIESLDNVDSGARVIVTEELLSRLFLPRITAIDSITDDLELLHWKVRTDAGTRTFLTTRGDPPRNLHNGMVLIKDVANDMYLIKSTAALDVRSRRLLWAYLD